jgi:hypothetical protein
LQCRARMLHEPGGVSKGKIFILIWCSCSSSDPTFNENLFPSFKCVWQVQQPEGFLGQLDGSCRTRQPLKFLRSHHSGLGAAEEGRAQEEKRGTKEMKHTFASSSRLPASYRLSLVILDSCVANKGTCKNVCNAEHFRAKGNTI